MLAGRYKIVKEFKDGGFSQTFLAKDLDHPEHRQCVIKRMCPPATDHFTVNAARTLFSKEVNALKKLGHHAQIPQLYTTFIENQEVYLVEEFIKGQSLGRELRWGWKWSEVQVLELLKSILTPLAFVHRQEVIHRDLKPENIIRRQHDQSLVLIDFGSIYDHHMNSDAVVGTDGYMPPEQLRGNPVLASDVYAVGMIAIKALTGINPVKQAVSIDEQTGKVNWRRYRTISPELAHIVEMMVCHESYRRYASASEALSSVNTLIEDRKNASGPTRRKMFRFAGYGALALLGTGAALPALLSERQTNSRISFKVTSPSESKNSRKPDSHVPEALPNQSLIPVPTPLDQAELIRRYGSYNDCCKIAKARGIQFNGAPTWEQLTQAFSYSDAILAFSQQYMATYPSSALAGNINVEVTL